MSFPQFIGRGRLAGLPLMFKEVMVFGFDS